VKAASGVEISVLVDFEFTGFIPVPQIGERTLLASDRCGGPGSRCPCKTASKVGPPPGEA